MKKFVVVEDFTEYQVNHFCENHEEVCRKVKGIIETGHCELEYIKILPVGELMSIDEYIDSFSDIKKEPA